MKKKKLYIWMQSPNGNIPIKYRQLCVLADYRAFLCDQLSENTSAARWESLSGGEETFSPPASARLHRVGAFPPVLGASPQKNTVQKALRHLLSLSFISQGEISNVHSKALVMGFPS